MREGDVQVGAVIADASSGVRSTITALRQLPIFDGRGPWMATLTPLDNPTIVTTADGRRVTQWRGNLQDGEEIGDGRQTCEVMEWAVAFFFDDDVEGVESRFVLVTVGADISPADWHRLFIEAEW
jgi:hypothetical protein